MVESSNNRAENAWGTRLSVSRNGILFEINSARVIIKGKSVNRGAGYGLEVPCEYHFEGDNFSCNWLKEKLVKDHFDIHSFLILRLKITERHCSGS